MNNEVMKVTAEMREKLTKEEKAELRSVKKAWKEMIAMGKKKGALVEDEEWTNYEKFQMEKYGNILPSSNND